MAAPSLLRLPRVARPQRRLPVALRSLAVRNYRLYALGNLVSVTGTWMQLVAQNWLVLRMTDSASSLGVTVALQSAPALLLGMHGGALADRLPKRALHAATQVVLTVLAALLALLAALHALQFWTIELFAV
ncbi:MAG TPA: MFS transporter, partial [Acidimicrobiia bacterium]|nr:MFS transporter [Acidimicrobiia bacterium]